MSKDIAEICFWKGIANKDEAQRTDPKYRFTLEDGKPCFKCDGTIEYAERIGCKSYMIKSGGRK